MRVRTVQWAAVIGLVGVLILGVPQQVGAVSPRATVGLPPSFVPLAPVPDVSANSLVGDLNGDGIPDVFGVSSGGGRSLIGRGDGTFAPIGTPVAPAAVLADMNGDGRADLVDAPDGQVRVRLARPDGTFPDAPFAYGYRSLLAGDLNGDGRADAVVTANGRARVFLGNGDDTTRGTATEVPADHLIAVADQTGDGRFDLIALRYTGSIRQYREVMVYTGDGAGGLAASGAGWTRLSNYFEATADFNRDGVRDVLVLGNVYLGSPDGSFRSVGTAPLGPRDAGDIDGDGFPDLVGNLSSGTTIWRGDGMGGFGTPQAACESNPACPIGEYAVADMDRDGGLDILDFTQGQMIVLLNHTPRPAPQPQQRVAATRVGEAQAIPAARLSVPTAMPQPPPRPTRPDAAMTPPVSAPLPLPPRR